MHHESCMMHESSVHLTNTRFFWRMYSLLFFMDPQVMGSLSYIPYNPVYSNTCFCRGLGIHSPPPCLLLRPETLRPRLDVLSTHRRLANPLDPIHFALECQECMPSLIFHVFTHVAAVIFFDYFPQLGSINIPDFFH